MSAEARSGRLLKGPVILQAAVWFGLPLVALVALLGYQMFGKRPIGPQKDPKDLKDPEENHLAQARSALAKQTDLPTCRTVVQMLNAHLQKSKEHAISPLSPSEAERVAKMLHLDPGDLAEVNATNFTPLDAHHLETCLLLREVARGLELQPVEAGGKAFRQAPLDRAAAAFARVCRQVRLEVSGMEAVSREPAPVAPVLRLGRGGPIERALVFLALLEQFGLEDDEHSGLQGCLVLTKDDKGAADLWCCGVAIGSKPDALYLFDPRLGLPVPGPGGKGVATLAQAQQDPAVLGQLKIDKLAYDVTPETAKRVTLSLVCPLSAVAPRMHLLQERLLRERTWRTQALPAAIRVRLAEDPVKAQASLQSAVAGSPGTEVTFTPRGAGILRRFLPKDDGGSDAPTPFDLRQLPGFTQPNDPARVAFSRQQVFQFQSVPWADLPAIFRTDPAFRPGSPVGDRLRLLFMSPFVRSLVEPNSPRDLVVRGRYTRAVPDLVQEQEQWQAVRRRLQQADLKELGEAIRAWGDRARGAHAELIRAKGTPEERTAAAAVEAVWKGMDFRPVELLTLGAIAGPRGADAMYQLALCRHEQAMRYQARVELAVRAGLPPGTDAANARKTWTDAEGYWKEYLDQNPGRPGVASGRRLRGEAQAMLGQREEAAKSLGDISAPMADLEKLGCLWLAKQLAAAKRG
jgi:hypothetical protein